MFLKSGDMRFSKSQFQVGNYIFDVVNEFVGLSSVVTSNNDIRLEIKRRINLANRGI